MVDRYLACTAGRGSSQYHRIALENGIYTLKGRGIITASYALSERLTKAIFSPDGSFPNLMDGGFLFGDEGSRQQNEISDAYERLKETLSVTNGYNLGKILRNASQRDCGFSIDRIRIERESQVERAIDSYFSALRQDLIIVLANLEGEIVHLFGSIPR